MTPEEFDKLVEEFLENPPINAREMFGGYIKDDTKYAYARGYFDEPILSKWVKYGRFHAAWTAGSIQLKMDEVDD